MGKVEAGTLSTGDTVTLQPLSVEAVVETILVNDEEVEGALPGENVKVRVLTCSSAWHLPPFTPVLCASPVPAFR